MDICVCFPGWGRSGGARVVGEHINRLVARGHNVVQVPNDGHTPDWFDLRCGTMSTQQARRSQWDVVIATNPTTVHPALLIGGAKLVYFVQMAEHRFFPDRSQEYVGAIQTYKLAARKEFHAITIADWLRDYLCSVGFERVDVIPNGVNSEHFYPVENDPDEDPYILIEGDHRNQAKDVEKIGWRVGQYLRQEFKHIKLKGVAAVHNDFTSHLDEFVLRPTVAAYRRLYSGALFLLKASKYEGRSLAPLEAMACGTPTVRALISGDDDLIHEQNCLRGGYNDKELMNLGRRALQDAVLLGDLRYNAMEYARAHLRWDPIIDRLEELLSDNHK